jgi:hypothetical protein
MHVHQHSLAVDVSDLQVQPLSQPQAERVDRPQVGLVVGRADRVDEPAHFVRGEHVGQCFVPLDAKLREGLPVARHGVGVEELDAAVGDNERRRRKALLILEEEKVLAHLLFAELVGRLVKVIGQLPDRAEVGLLRALGESAKLQVVRHLLS